MISINKLLLHDINIAYSITLQHDYPGMIMYHIVLVKCTGNVHCKFINYVVHIYSDLMHA